MKRTFTLLVVLIIGLTVVGQNAKTQFTKKKKTARTGILKIGDKFFPKIQQFDFSKIQALVELTNHNNSLRVTKQALDSMQVIEEGIVTAKDLYYYNEHGNCIMELKSVLNNSNVMTYYEKVSYTFDGVGRPISYKTTVWDNDLGSWVDESRMDMTYSAGMLSELSVFMWDGEINEWDEMLRGYYEYNGLNQVTSVILKYKNEEIWGNYSKEEYTYKDGYPFLTISYLWNPVNSSWLNQFKDEDYFDENGDIIVNLSSDWNMFTSTWDDLYKNEYTNDENHLMTSSSYSEYSEITLQWEYFYKDEYFYDDNNDNNIVVSYNMEGGEWVKDSKDELAFNYNYSPGEMVFTNDYMSDFGFYHYMVTEINGFVWDGDWTDYSNTIYYFSPMEVDGLEEQPEDNTRIYPNPSNGIINMEFSGSGKEYAITFVDITGKTIDQEIITNISGESFNKSFDLSEYKSGVYFIKISNAGTISTQKIIIQ